LKKKKNLKNKIETVFKRIKINMKEQKGIEIKQIRNIKVEECKVFNRTAP